MKVERRDKKREGEEWVEFNPSPDTISVISEAEMGGRGPHQVSEQIDVNGYRPNTDI